ncbi:MAG TPA: ParB N-terminal domain-containing protein [Chloroflexota bacterium]|nr:ParB N-terminal domain-containing protein [Chloroflexota bacterium]
MRRHLPRVETVDTQRIIGSVSRAHEVRRDFRPPRRSRRRSDNQRYDSIVRAMQRGRELPPIELYRLGDDYYVVDGHHRVAAALEVGQLAMDAQVVEFASLN